MTQKNNDNLIDEENPKADELAERLAKIFIAQIKLNKNKNKHNNYEKSKKVQPL